MKAFVALVVLLPGNVAQASAYDPSAIIGKLATLAAGFVVVVGCVFFSIARLVDWWDRRAARRNERGRRER